MAVLSYKCPNCGGGLLFDPGTQKFRCEYCMSYFTNQQADAIQPSGAEPAPEEDGGLRNAVGYSCPSCGAQVMTGETTAADICFYCHNPVVLSERLDGELKPDQVIAFVLDQKDAQQRLQEWCGKKKFLRRDFTTQTQLEKMVGVYFPFWLADSSCASQLTAKGNRIRVWRTGNVEYTETQVYQLIRQATISFQDMPFGGIDRKDITLASSVYPFDFKAAVPFDIRYLMGFQAERRTLEASQFREILSKQSAGYADVMLKETIPAYTGLVIQDSRSVITGERWRYTLLPVWVMTYRYARKEYFFAVNGQTGKVCGRLPVSFLKLAVLFAGVSAAVFGLLQWGGGLLV